MPLCCAFPEKLKENLLLAGTTQAARAILFAMCYYLAQGGNNTQVAVPGPQGAGKAARLLEEQFSGAWYYKGRHGWHCFGWNLGRHLPHVK